MSTGLAEDLPERSEEVTKGYRAPEVLHERRPRANFGVAAVLGVNREQIARLNRAFSQERIGLSEVVDANLISVRDGIKGLALLHAVLPRPRSNRSHAAETFCWVGLSRRRLRRF